MSLLRSLFDPGDWLAIKPQLDPQSPVLQLTHVPDAGEVKLRIWLGLAVLAVVAVVIYFVRRDGFAVFVACGFGFFGLLNLVYGVLQSGFSMSLAITSSEVMVDSATLFGAHNWREPLSNYRGVLLREEQIRDSSSSRIAPTRRFFIVELAHHDPSRNVAVYVKEAGPSPRGVQEAFARRFDLPALSPDSSGESARLAAELDRELAEQGGRFADPGPAPSGVTLKQRDGATRIVVGAGTAARGFAWLWWLSIPILFGGVAYMIDPRFAPVAGGMGAVFVLMILGLGMLFEGRGGRNEWAICIDAEKVWVTTPSGSSLPRSRIEQVRVDSYTSDSSDSKRGTSRHARLIIEGDAGRLEYIGTQFDRKKLEWVRDYLLYRLTTRT